MFFRKDIHACADLRVRIEESHREINGARYNLCEIASKLPTVKCRQERLQGNLRCIGASQIYYNYID